jgi:hypothetical protein
MCKSCDIICCFRIVDLTEAKTLQEIIEAVEDASRKRLASNVLEAEEDEMVSAIGKAIRENWQ